jgi:hypothetical protein
MSKKMYLENLNIALFNIIGLFFAGYLLRVFLIKPLTS